ncbi:MAG: sulfatase [Opitutales bacterium]|nr:sulfatase [Opitutales bacterium]
MNTKRNGILAIALIGFLSISSVVFAANARPNVLWIIAEDMSQDLGCYGNELVHTPNIDGLAREGMRFDRVFTTGPACSPSRTALATGVYQTTLGAYHMRYSDELLPVLPAPYKILPELMRKNGYYSGNIKKFGKTGTGKDDWLFQTSQKSWDTNSWDDLVDNQPFFAQINFSESHRAFARKSKYPIDTDKISIPPYYPDHPVSREDWAGYLEEVNVADEHVGDILAKLKEDGLAKNTIVIFLSDHGRPMIRAKNWLYDGGTLVPMVIHYPENVDTPSGFEIGSSNSNIISGVDLVAETLLMTGASIPDWMQGRSFLRSDSRSREYLYTAVDRIGDIDSRSRAVRTQRFKYIRNYKIPGSVNESTTQYRRASHPIYHLLNIMGEKGLLPPVQAKLLEPIASEELYDLENDPFEIVNLVGNPKFAAMRGRFERNLTDWIESSGDRGFEEDSDAIVEHFNAYGISTAKRQKDGIKKRRAAVEAYFE